MSEIEKLIENFPFVPNNGRVIVKIDDKEEEQEWTSEGGIILTESSKTARSDLATATVIAISSGKFNPHTGEVIQHRVKPNQQVSIGRHAGVKIRVLKEEFTLIFEEDILGFYNF